MAVLKMADLDIKGKKLLIRQDLNVPVEDGKVTNDKRIRASLPTIKQALEAGALVMVMSHRGRPTEGEYDESFSMKPVAEHNSRSRSCSLPISSEKMAAPVFSRVATL